MSDPLKPATLLAEQARTPFPGASREYEEARRALLAEEIEFRRHLTRLTEQRTARSSARTTASATSRAPRSA